MNNLKFIVDECVGIHIAKWLKINNYDAISIAEEMPGTKDSIILNQAFSENRIVITSDKDFGDLVFHKKLLHAGIILLRLQDESPKNKIKVLGSLLNNYYDQISCNFIVVSDSNVKIIKQFLN